jgi:starch synthase
MTKKRVLIVTQEMKPYTSISEISEIANQLPKYLFEKGMELRILMPKYGTINERRHRLHEVVRLSGMNIIVDDDDYPLIIKVASLPGSRMQVYFLDNEDFFKRKSIFEDDRGKPFKDNSDRMIFFCKSAIETVKKFGWAPDVIHCHGWMTALIPAYLKKAYNNEPLFQNSKVIYSAYQNEYVKHFNDKKFLDKAAINYLTKEDLGEYMVEDKLDMNHGAITSSDGVISGSEEIDVSGASIPNLPYIEEDYLPSYLEFYDSLTEVGVEE